MHSAENSGGGLAERSTGCCGGNSGIARNGRGRYGHDITDVENGDEGETETDDGTELGVTSSEKETEEETEAEVGHVGERVEDEYAEYNGDGDEEPGVTGGTECSREYEKHADCLNCMGDEQFTEERVSSNEDGKLRDDVVGGI